LKTAHQMGMNAVSRTFSDVFVDRWGTNQKTASLGEVLRMKKIISYSVIAAFFALTSISQAIPTVISVGAEEYPGNLSARVPTIAVDSLNQPHIAADVANSSAVSFFDKIGNNWQSAGYIASGSSGQFYNPHMEINDFDQAFISGVLWYPGGLGSILRINMKTNPTLAGYWTDNGPQATWPVGNLSIDPRVNNAYGINLNVGDWVYYSVTPNPQSPMTPPRALLGYGNVGSGLVGGEKNGFWISKAGDVPHMDGSLQPIWNFCTEQYYQSSARFANGLGLARWADWNTYHAMWDDGAYPAIVSDNVTPGIVYLATSFQKNYGGPLGIFMNIFNGNDFGEGDFLFSSSALLSIDPNGTSGLRRYAPQLYPANKGGAWLVWSRGGRVKLRYIRAPQSGETIGTSAYLNASPEYDICDGSLADICVDTDGNIHLAYGNGGQRYRKILIDGDSGNQESNNKYLPGDYDGNGLDDLCVYYPATGTWYIKYNNGDGTFTREEVINWGWSEAVAVPADYDGDGTTDRAVYYADTGLWYVFLSKSQQAITVNFGWSEAQAVPADYTGDGRANFAVYYPDTGAWMVSISGAETKVVYNGYSEALPVAGDFDGDEIDDFAVYVPENGWWSVLRGGEYNTKIVDKNWGWAEAMPTPGDYDADGKTDVCVYSPANGDWMAWLSGTETTATNNWGFADTVPVPGHYYGGALKENGIPASQIGIYYKESGIWALTGLAADRSWAGVDTFGWAETLPPGITGN